MRIKIILFASIGLMLSCSILSRSPHKTYYYNKGFSLKEINPSNSKIVFIKNIEITAYQPEYKVYFFDNEDNFVDTLFKYIDKFSSELYNNKFEKLLIHNNHQIQGLDSLAFLEHNRQEMKYIIKINKILIGQGTMSGTHGVSTYCRLIIFVDIYDKTLKEKYFSGEILGMSSTIRSRYVQAVRDALYLASAELVYGIKKNFLK